MHRLGVYFMVTTTDKVQIRNEIARLFQRYPDFTIPQAMKESPILKSYGRPDLKPLFSRYCSRVGVAPSGSPVYSPKKQYRSLVGTSNHKISDEELLEELQRILGRGGRKTQNAICSNTSIFEGIHQSTIRSYLNRFCFPNGRQVVNYAGVSLTAKAYSLLPEYWEQIPDILIEDLVPQDSSKLQNILSSKNSLRPLTPDAQVLADQLAPQINEIFSDGVPLTLREIVERTNVLQGVGSRRKAKIMSVFCKEHESVRVLYGSNYSTVKTYFPINRTPKGNLQMSKKQKIISLTTPQKELLAQLIQKIPDIFLDHQPLPIKTISERTHLLQGLAPRAKATIIAMFCDVIGTERVKGMTSSYLAATYYPQKGYRPDSKELESYTESFIYNPDAKTLEQEILALLDSGAMKTGAATQEELETYWNTLKKPAEQLSAFLNYISDPNQDELVMEIIGDVFRRNTHLYLGEPNKLTKDTQVMSDALVLVQIALDSGPKTVKEILDETGIDATPAQLEHLLQQSLKHHKITRGYISDVIKQDEYNTHSLGSNKKPTGYVHTFRPIAPSKSISSLELEPEDISLPDCATCFDQDTWRKLLYDASLGDVIKTAMYAASDCTLEKLGLVAAILDPRGRINPQNIRGLIAGLASSSFFELEESKTGQILVHPIYNSKNPWTYTRIKQFKERPGNEISKIEETLSSILSKKDADSEIWAERLVENLLTEHDAFLRIFVAKKKRILPIFEGHMRSRSGSAWTPQGRSSQRISTKLGLVGRPSITKNQFAKRRTKRISLEDLDTILSAVHWLGTHNGL